LIKREIEQQNIDSRLAQEPEQAAFRMVRDELADAIFRQIAGLGNTGAPGKARPRARCVDQARWPTS
jgi:hypothetical protein